MRTYPYLYATIFIVATLVAVMNFTLPLSKKWLGRQKDHHAFANGRHRTSDVVNEYHWYPPQLNRRGGDSPKPTSAKTSLELEEEVARGRCELSVSRLEECMVEHQTSVQKQKQHCAGLMEESLRYANIGNTHKALSTHQKRLLTQYAKKLEYPVPKGTKDNASIYVYFNPVRRLNSCLSNSKGSNDEKRQKCKQAKEDCDRAIKIFFKDPRRCRLGRMPMAYRNAIANYYTGVDEREWKGPVTWTESDIKSKAAHAKASHKPPGSDLPEQPGGATEGRHDRTSAAQKDTNDQIFKGVFTVPKAQGRFELQRFPGGSAQAVLHQEKSPSRSRSIEMKNSEESAGSPRLTHDELFEIVNEEH